MPFLSRFRLLPLAATLLVMLIGIALGNWQTKRAYEKEAIEAKLIARESVSPFVLTDLAPAIDDAEFRQVKVKGEFVQDWPIYLDNRPHHGVAGFYVLMPLKIEGTEKHILIARGWVARNLTDRTKLPGLVTPSGLVTIQGLVRRNAGHVMQLGEAQTLQPHAIVQNAEVADFAAAGKLTLHPFIINQTSAMDDGLIRDWTRPSTGSEKHRGYAFQWYGLAMMAGIFFVVTGFRRGTRQEKK